MAKKPEKWLQQVQKHMVEKGTKGATHKYLGVPEGEKIPMSKLNEALKRKGLKPTTRKRLQFAKNMSELAARKKAHAASDTMTTLTAIAAEFGCNLVGAGTVSA